MGVKQIVYKARINNIERGGQPMQTQMLDGIIHVTII